MNDDRRNHLIDLMRFLAALWVAFYHFNQPIAYVDNWYRNFSKLGYLGVPVFFVISGYCVTLSAYHSKSWKDFITRRLFRIFPPYYFSLVVVLLVVLILKFLTGYNSVATLPKSASSIFLSLTLLTKPFSNISGINWVYWSLTCELFFYMVVCVAITIRSKLQIPLFIAISLLAIIVPVHTGGPLFILKNWPPFAIGVCIYFIYGQKNKASALLLLLVSSLALIKNFMLNNELPYFIATVIATVLICLGLKYKLKNNTFSKLGDYSYSVYLLHVPLGAFLMGHYKTPVIQQNIYFNIGYDTVTYLLTLGAAYLSFKFIELPSIKAGKQFSQKLSGKKVKLVNHD